MLSGPFRLPWTWANDSVTRVTPAPSTPSNTTAPVVWPRAGTVPPNELAAGSALRVFAPGTSRSAFEYTGRVSASFPVFLAVIVTIVAWAFTRTDDTVTV